MAAVAAPPSGYLAVAPRVFRAGQRELVSVSLLRHQQPASGPVEVAIVKDGQTVARAAAQVQGRADVPIDVPAKAAEGDYQLQLKAGSLSDQSPVRVEDGTLLFLETDKPIYKPGQTIHFRVLTLDPALKPVASAATVELADAKGLKIFKQDVQTDDFGMATLDLPLSTEPNLGVWKATARAGKRTAQLDVRVERYVLPKYEVKVSLPKEWALASESIAGTVSAEYSYGKPVQGEVQIKATRYRGAWEEFANVTKPLDGKADFQLPPAQYVAGVPGSGGLGNVSLEVTVREKSTGYEERTTKLVAVAATPTVLRVIPESLSFKPGLPLSLLVLAETPDRKPVDATVQLNVSYTKPDFARTPETRQASVKGGKALVKVTPPTDAISLTLSANTPDKAYTSLALQAGYSPTGAFVHVEQTTEGALKVGDTAKFHVTATREAGSFYYEVVARGSVIYSDFSKSPDIEVPLTPPMAPLARLLVYQILQSSEVAADYVPFSVDGTYPQKVQVGFSKEEAKPGDPVDLTVQTEGQARVGLAAVDRSVFILAENRLNLQQVFTELERLYQRPQAELHSLGQPVGGGPVPLPRPAPEPAAAPARPGVAPVAPAPFVPDPFASGKVTTRGAREVFGDAGVVVLSNQQVPAGKEYQQPHRLFAEAAGALPAAARAPMATAAPAAKAAAPREAAAMDKAADDAGLAEVQRVRQFFPETWLWDTLTTDASGKATKRVEAPDSITTWMLRTVALSKAAGLGVGEAQLRVLQPFFVQVDLPYSVIRGEEFPVKIALYNYQAQPEEFVVELEKADWFDLLDPASARVPVAANDLGGVSFKIRPTRLGVDKVKVTARSRSTADAIVKELIVEPEGVQREIVDNLVLSAGTSKQLDLTFPTGVIEGSPRAYLALTGSYLTQTIEGLEGLLKMPFGCGEQNMILFAPNVFVTRYLKETGQTKPEVMAKAETLMMTGYQRELIYRRSDGSFSAFGNSDKDGSLWLTAFVLKTFAQAKSVIFIDDAVLASAKTWIAKQQKADGSFEPVGFVHHQELLGGLSGKPALTAYLAIALKEAGDDAAAGKAVRYLEGALDTIDDPYALAIGAYALGLTKSPKAGSVADRLLKLGKESDEGLSWGDAPGQPEPAATAPAGGAVPPRPGLVKSAAIETTGYALLAFLEKGDRLTASRAARWLVSRRNAYGGFGSTQDTVVGLQALTQYASTGRADVDATVKLSAGSWQHEAKVTAQNADVLQVIQAPIGGPVSVNVAGKGQVVLQAVRRFNVPDAAERRQSIFQLEVDYGTAQVAVDDLITVTASVKYTPPEPIAAGMVVLDVAVPTGFAPEAPTLDELVKRQPKLKRYEVAGRKVIFYVEDMAPEEKLTLTFKARALYPVRAQAVTSQAYSYYRPDWKGESLGGALVVRGS